MPVDHSSVGTDQDKLLSQLEMELRESQQIVQLQQQMLQVGSQNPLRLIAGAVRT